MTPIEEIIQFISGEMKPEQERIFNERLASDPDLLKEYQTIKRIWEHTKENLTLKNLPETASREEHLTAVLAAIDIEKYNTPASADDEIAFKETLKQIVDPEEASETTDRKRSLFNYRMGLLLAACITLLLVIFLPEKNMQELAGMYYDPVSNPLLDMGSTRNSSEVPQAYLLFRDGRFDAAKAAFESAGTGADMAPMEKLFYAISCFETEKSEKSLVLLKESAASQDHQVAYHASWYLALIYLQTGAPELAMPWLVKTANSDGIYQQKARKLIRKTE
ncbi:MAG: hypothetical protein K9G38_04105 [Bacteroidales bacterium]|nr:hypothetical protein [Bacteroidales bacterium]